MNVNTQSSQEMAVLIGADVGGTRIKALLADAGGTVSERATVPTTTHGTPVATLMHLLDDLVGKAHASGRPVHGIGAAVPGVVDRETGTVVQAANLGWRDLALADELGRRYGVPVTVDHDARTAAEAEWVAREASGQRVEHAAFVPVGTGIAAALRLAGQSVTGSGCAAGELGHLVVAPGGEPCSCGGRGCLETYASASAIARRYKHLGGRGPRDAAAVAAAIHTDPVAEQVWGDAIRALTQGLVALVALVDPELIVVGGGLSAAGSTLVTPLRDGVARQLPWRRPPRIELSMLGPAAGQIGALLLAGAARSAPSSPAFDAATENASLTSIDLQPSSFDFRW